jgi:hypothetical protein
MQVNMAICLFGDFGNGGNALGLTKALLAVMTDSSLVMLHLPAEQEGLFVDLHRLERKRFLAGLNFFHVS